MTALVTKLFMTVFLIHFCFMARRLLFLNSLYKIGLKLGVHEEAK